MLANYKFRNKIDLIVSNNFSTKSHLYIVHCHAAQNLSRFEHQVVTKTYVAFIPHFNQICSMNSENVMKMQKV